MPMIPNEARKAIYLRFLKDIEDGGELSLSCLVLHGPSGVFSGVDLEAAEMDLDVDISDTAPFDDNPNLAVILTTTDPDPDEKYYFARRGYPKMWTSVTDEVTVLNRALEPPPGARLHGSPSLSRRITFDNEKI